MKTAAAYIRVSTEDQIEYSPDSQIRMIREYAKRNDYTLPEKYIFIDEGISGKTAEKRPSFMRMIGTAKMKPKPFCAILLWKFSRFARSREDSIVYKSMLRKQLGIEVISVSENLGDDKMSVLIEAMIEAMDEYYSINLAEEVKRGMTEKAKRGEPLSIPPFGYRMENKQLVPISGESDIIRQVFDWYNSGMSMLQIAKNLNAAGVRTHRGNPIENRTVDYWLNNPVYIGKIRWTPTGKTSRNFHNSDSLVIDGSHEPLIDISVWEQARERAAKRSCGSRRGASNKISHWLTGLARCGICGRPLVNCGGYFYCSGRSKGTCRGNGSIRADVFEKYVLSELERLIGENIVISASKPRKQNTDIYLTQLKHAEARMKRVKEAYEAGIDSMEEYKENKLNIQNEIDSIKSEMQTRSVPEARKKIQPSFMLLSDKSVRESDKNLIAREFIKEIVKTGEDGLRLNIIYKL